MKKGLLTYTLCWILLLALFNVACFVTPSETAEYDKFAGAFWPGYVLITLTFIGHLLCAVWSFRENNKQKFFYRIPLIRVSYIGLILAAIIGAACMVIPNLPIWAGIIISFAVLVFTAIAVLKANLAANAVMAIDNRVKTETFFVKSKTVEAEALLNRAKTEETKTACKKVYEALRYSDPMSNEALIDNESQIALKFNEFSFAVTENEENVVVLADELVVLIDDRNKKCKFIK